MRIGLVGSGGGHVRQLLDLEGLWGDTDYFFVTEDTALTRDIAAKHRTHFVPHVALGQARLGKPFRMALAGVRSLWTSLGIVWRERPDAVITTGAGSCYFTVLFARLLGARIVLIDSFARFSGPSAFARIATRLAHVRIAQSQQSADRWPGARVFDPFRFLDKVRPAKEPLVFATVGATLPFDRLVRLVDQAKREGLLPENVILQTGIGGTEPIGDGITDVRETLDFEDVKQILQRADIVICHGGTGSIITALREGCRVIVIPRIFKRGEHYDDHQWEIAQAFADRGIVTMVGEDDDIATAIAAARQLDPVCATLDPSALMAELRSLFDQWKTEIPAKGRIRRARQPRPAEQRS